MSLRALEASDLETLAGWRNDPRVRPHFFTDRDIDPAGQGAWLASVRADGTRRFFAVDAGGTLAGTISLDGIDRDRRSAEVGNVLIDPERQGRGLGLAAVRRVIEIGFGTEGLERLELRVFSDNRRAIALYERCGFRSEGVERGAVLKDGRRRDVLRMGILRSDASRAEASADEPNRRYRTDPV